MILRTISCKAIAVLILASGISVPAYAQSAEPSSTAADKVCKKPELRDQISVSQEQLQNLAEAAQAYVDCMGALVDAKRKRAQAMYDEAKAAAESNNAAVVEVNAFIEAFRSYQNKHKDDK